MLYHRDAGMLLFIQFELFERGQIISRKINSIMLSGTFFNLCYCHSCIRNAMCCSSRIISTYIMLVLYTMFNICIFWLVQSLDLSIIKYVWGIIEWNLTCSVNLSTIFALLHQQMWEAWNNALQDGICILYDHIHTRVQRGYTVY